MVKYAASVGQGKTATPKVNGLFVAVPKKRLYFSLAAYMKNILGVTHRALLRKAEVLVREEKLDMVLAAEKAKET